MTRSLVERVEALAADAEARPAAPGQPNATEERARQLSVGKLLLESGVPQRYAQAGLDRIQEPFRAIPGYIVAAAALDDLLDAPAILALIGSRGTGKTWLACAAVQDCCRRGRRGVYLNTFDYFQAMKATYGDRSAVDESKVEQRYVRPALLVLDEIHERGDTAWEDRTLTRLLNKRYEAELATVLVSNQSPEEFAARVGESIADRIHDGGGVIVCEWGSLRGRTR